jgi:hypothetical protein
VIYYLALALLAFLPLCRALAFTFYSKCLVYILAFMNALHVSAKSNQKLPARIFSFKVSNKALTVSTENLLMPDEKGKRFFLL